MDNITLILLVYIAGFCIELAMVLRTDLEARKEIKDWDEDGGHELMVTHGVLDALMWPLVWATQVLFFILVPSREKKIEIMSKFLDGRSGKDGN